MRTVLLVDDDPEVRLVMAEALTDQGYRVREAKDGAQGLEMLTSAVPLPDAIVLDLSMPNMTGWQFRDLQRRREEIAEVPVVVVTASKPLGIDAAAVLEKPFPLGELVRVLGRVIESARARSRSPAA
ncbi:response regulator [Anaeromyxobacter oryzae]|uniref:Response regulator n=1 Tax=Anaeromyxobacter oryzae TaxID=2918170 RepID=A0ABM7X0F2_9BACT|nr:response regulator [Anaeromyxobacter oryzae]BDG05215.1 response regulator [Anaeromyxobacter oryzae]